MSGRSKYRYLGGLRLLRSSNFIAPWPPFASARTGHVGDHMVPMPHFGAILELPDWHALAALLRAADTAFVLEPQVRFEGQPGEQWTMFFHDPSGNPIEIKGFRSLNEVYAA